MESVIRNHPVPHAPGFGPAVIEILNRSGQVLQRFHYTGGEIRVGRAYDNDIIIGDPFICPHHLLIRSEQGKLILEDLDSVNGTWHQKGRVKLREAEFHQGELVQLGHSQLRFQSIDSELAPAWRDTARHGLFSLLGRPWTLPLAGVLCVLALALDKMIDSPGELVPAVLASQLLYPLLGVMLWSGFWSLLNQLIAHRANFRIHLSIAALAVAALFINAEGVPLAGFAFGWSALVGWVNMLGQITILGVALIAHMKFATHGRTRILALGSGLLATMLIAIPQYGQISQNKEFSSLPRLSPLLKPPVTRLVKGVSVDQFIERAEGLRQDLERETAD
jgi:hypothetical protein